MSTFNELIDFTRSTTGTYLDSVVYGEELVTNGTFDDGTTGWASGGNAVISVSSGELTITGDGGYNDYAQQVINVTVGKPYLVSFTGRKITSNASGQVRESLAPYGYLIENTFSSTSDESFQQTFVATQSALLVQLVVWSVGGGSIAFDNVSVKEVIGGQVSGTPLLRTAAINEPRLEYDAQGNALGLLIEEARTNLFRYSQELSNVSHSLITTDNATVSPDGAQNASLCIPTSANVEHYIDDQIVIAGTDYAISCFAKYGSGSHLLSFRGASIGANAPRFDLQTGTVVNEGASGQWSNTKIEDVGNGWYKCSSVGNPNYLTPLRFQIIRSDGATTFIGDGTGHYIYGAQVEEGAFPTSYIPTSGSAVTRAVDFCSMPISRFFYNTSEGSLFVVFDIATSEANKGICAINNSASPTDNRVDLRSQGTAFITSDNVDFDGLNVSSFNQYTTNKAAFAFKSGDSALVKNGGTVDTLSSVFTLPSFDILRVGSIDAGTPNLGSGHIKSIQYYPLRLSDTKLQELTS